MQIFIAISIVTVLVALYILGYILNKRTEAPELDIPYEKCSTCTSSTCAHKS